MYEEGFRWWNMGYAAAIAFVLFALILGGHAGCSCAARAAPEAQRVKRRLAHASPLHAALVAAAALHAAAAALDGVGVAHADRARRARVPPRCCPRAPTLEHYRDAVRAPRPRRAHFAQQPADRGRRRRSSRCSELDGRLRLRASCASRGRDRALPRCCSRRSSIPGQVGDAAALPDAARARAREHLRRRASSRASPASSASSSSASTRSRIPDELLDAARVDGAGELRIFWSIVLPLLRPILVTLGALHLPGHVERLPLAAHRARPTTRLHTLPVALANLLGEHVQDTELMMAGAVLTVLPVLRAVPRAAALRTSQGIVDREREGMSATLAQRAAAALASRASRCARRGAGADAAHGARRLRGRARLDARSLAAARALEIAPDAGTTGSAHAPRLRLPRRRRATSIARKAFALTLPDELSRSRSELRGEAPPNTLEFKLVDPSGDNVWWRVQRDYRVPARLAARRASRSRQLEFAWGPQAGGEPRPKSARLEIAITRGAGRQGHGLDRRPRARGARAAEPRRPAAGRDRVDASRRARAALCVLDGDPQTSWRSGELADRQWLQLDFGSAREYGGLVVDWDPERLRRSSYRVQVSDDGETLDAARTPARPANGGRDYVYLPDGESRYVRLALAEQSGPAATSSRELAVQPIAFSALAERRSSTRSRASALARHLSASTSPASSRTGRSSASTATRKEALLSEEGMLEVDKGAFSIEPFLFVDGALVTWSDVAADAGARGRRAADPVGHLAAAAACGSTIDGLRRRAGRAPRSCTPATAREPRRPRARRRLSSSRSGRSRCCRRGSRST